MSQSAKNLIVVLAIITTVFVAYYFFTQESALGLRTGESDVQLQQLVQSANEYRAREQILRTITLDTGMFESEVFASLRDYSPEPKEFRVSRPDPFLPSALDTTRSPDDSE